MVKTAGGAVALCVGLAGCQFVIGLNDRSEGQSPSCAAGDACAGGPGADAGAGGLTAEGGRGAKGGAGAGAGAGAPDTDGGRDEGQSGAGGAMDADPLSCMTVVQSSAALVGYTFAPQFTGGAEPANPQPFSISACNFLDIVCEQPVFGPTLVDSGVAATFMVPPDFAGYFRIANPDTMPAVLFLGRPVRQDTRGTDWSIPSKQALEQLALATGQSIDPELGFVLVKTKDCHGDPLADVTVDNSKGGLEFYFANLSPYTTLTKTSAEGMAAIANVPPSTTVLSGRHSTGTMLGPVSARAVSEWMTLVELYP